MKEINVTGQKRNDLGKLNFASRNEKSYVAGEHPKQSACVAERSDTEKPLYDRKTKGGSNQEIRAVMSCSFLIQFMNHIKII